MLHASSTSILISHLQVHDFNKGRHTVEVSLLSFSTIGRDKNSSHEARRDWTSDKALVFEAQRIAGLIYLGLVLRGCAVTGAVLRALALQLMNITSTLRGDFAYTECRPKMAMWIYFMGALLALDHHEGLCFVEGIARTMRDSRIGVWKEVEGALKEVLWVDGLQAKACKQVWQRVQGLCTE